MSVIDSNSGKVVRNYSIEELIEAANLMRGYDLVALHAAGSGHAGGTLSIMDITAALYLKIANHDPKNPNWSTVTASSGRQGTRHRASIWAWLLPGFARRKTW